MKLGRALMLFVMVVGIAAAAQSREENVGTLELDGLSFISFENVENLAIPSGSTIRFHFNEEVSNGVASFSVNPSDLSMPAIPLPGGQGELVYTLAKSTTGTLRQGEHGYVVSFAAKVNATFVHPTEGGSLSHTLVFTTEHAQATGSESHQTVSLEGMEVVPGPRYVQIVGAVPNPENAHPHPGRAVYTVLSGTFDWLPAIQ